MEASFPRGCTADPLIPELREVCESQCSLQQSEAPACGQGFPGGRALVQGPSRSRRIRRRLQEPPQVQRGRRVYSGAVGGGAGGAVSPG